MLEVADSSADLRHLCGQSRTIFVPTMGALHDGHASLIRQAANIRQAGEKVVVSIFVNPTQFNDASDLARYPRTLQSDISLCEAAGADVVFAPEATEIYPPGEGIQVPLLPAAAGGHLQKPGLEDALRPGHFEGVCQVVKRLFDLVAPRVAIFGEKDWQQLVTIEQMVSMLWLPIEIIHGTTIREHDGLAMSSRNRFLSPAERSQAGSIYQAMHKALACDSIRQAERALAQHISSAGLTVQYAEIRHSLTLAKQPDDAKSGRMLVAAKLGSIRLIDNMAWH